MTDAARTWLSVSLAAGAGLAVLVAQPPVGLWPATFLGPALLLIAFLVDDAGTGAGRTGRLGLLFGLALFAPMLTWLILPAGYFGWALLATVQAAWFGLMGLAVRPFLASRWLPLVFAVAWVGVDSWRSIVPMNGFEWGALSYAHVEGSWLLPLARLAGGHAITFVVVLLAGLAVAAVHQAAAALRNRAGQPMDRALAGTRPAVIALVVVLFGSAVATIEPPAETGSLEVLLVQGNDIRHWEQPASNPPLRITTAMRDETLAAIEADGQPDLTIWPESSVDRDPWRPRGEELRPLMEDAAEAAGRMLVGMTLDGPDPANEFLNVAMVLDADATELDRYVKRRLVPFGEYIPFRRYLDWFPPLEQIPRDGQPGPGPQALDIDGAKVAVIICFETLFPFVTRSNLVADEDPAQLLVAITNDASFGDSAEPAQHLAQSRLRAVESGRWVVHGALSGSSAFADPGGRVHDATGLFEVDSIRREVPLVDGLTPFLRTGDWLGWATRTLVTLGLALSLLLWLRDRRAPGERSVAQDAVREGVR